MAPLPPGFTLRLLRLSDERALLEFFNFHSMETVFQRYHYCLSAMSHERALALLSVDQERDVALAVIECAPEAERIHAIARYYTELSGVSAEMAFVVRESMRRRGFATHLLLTLGAIANRHGLRWLRAQILRSNIAMRSVLNPFVSKIHDLPLADVVEYVVPVANLATHHSRSPIATRTTR